MTDPSTQSGDNLPAKSTDDTGMPLIIYILYLVTCLGIGIAALVGVIMAYVLQGKASSWVQSHYQFQIRTFWIALVVSIIAFLLLFVFFLGAILYGLLAIWIIIRCVRGIIWLQAGEAVPDPTSWLFGQPKSA
ncbi:MAG: hypothetical protein AAF563_08755 [Pseudomonadota bacterium]